MNSQEDNKARKKNAVILVIFAGITIAFALILRYFYSTAIFILSLFVLGFFGLVWWWDLVFRSPHRAQEKRQKIEQRQKKESQTITTQTENSTPLSLLSKTRDSSTIKITPISRTIVTHQRTIRIKKRPIKIPYGRKVGFKPQTRHEKKYFPDTTGPIEPPEED